MDEPIAVEQPEALPGAVPSQVGAMRTNVSGVLKSHLSWRQAAAFLILKSKKESVNYEERVAFCLGSG